MSYSKGSFFIKKPDFLLKVIILDLEEMGFAPLCRGAGGIGYS